MKIVGVVRTLNEDDIIESVIRHNIAQMDHIVVLDDGSNDRTVEILKKLIAEGLSINLIENRCVISNEMDRCTSLYNVACDDFGAEWVVLFDADEFIDTGLLQISLRKYLETVPTRYEGIHIQLYNYLNAASDNADEINVAKRMVWRHIEPTGAEPKIILRAMNGIIVEAGNHNARRNGRPLYILKEPNIILAHYFRRSAWHELYKCIIGRLKVIAAGPSEDAKGTGGHYNVPYTRMLEDPGRLLNSHEYFNKEPDKKIMANVPIAYLGGDLRYTRKIDYKLKCISMVLKYANELAVEFGRIMDSDPAAKRRITNGGR